jgi:predicted glutamine amidotransferase
MSRLFGCMCNDPERLACALFPARESLVAQAAPEGWGLAFFQGGEVLLQRHPKPVVGPLDFFNSVRELRSDYVVGHVRESGTQSKLENTQPYRFRQWVYAQSGQILQFSAIQAGMLEQIPDFLRRNIRGQNDSEHMFHLFLSFLHDGGKLDDPNIRVVDAARAIGATTAMVDRLVSATQGEAAGTSAINVVITNGRIMLALRRGKPMWMRHANTIPDCRLCQTGDSRDARERRRVAHEHVRSTLVVSEADKLGPEGWEEVPESSIVAISRDLTTTNLPLKG